MLWFQVNGFFSIPPTGALIPDRDHGTGKDSAGDKGAGIVIVLVDGDIGLIQGVIGHIPIVVMMRAATGPDGRAYEQQYKK
jgi:hypothetical protein